MGPKAFEIAFSFSKKIKKYINATSKWPLPHHDSSYAIYGTFIELENMGTYGAQFARPSEMADL